MDLDKKKLKKQLEKMNPTQLAEFMKENSVYIKNFESLTKEQAIQEIIDQIEGMKFYEEKFS